jgi:SAM-dependent methyltransferase
MLVELEILSEWEIAAGLFRGLRRFWRSSPMPQSGGSAHIATVQTFYVSLLDELNQANYTDSEKALLANRRLYYGRYLNSNLRDYFVEAVIPHIARAIPWVETSPKPHIFDLGCGLGMQSIIFASLGARVVGYDIRSEAIALCRKRKEFYEKKLGRELDITFMQGNFLNAKAEDFDTRFDMLFSMAAFSNIRPLEHTVKLVSAILKPDAKIYLYEKNSSHVLNLLRRTPEPRPSRTVAAFEKEGFTPCFLRGAGAFPSAFWKSMRLNQAVVHPANHLLEKSLPLSINYVLGLQRGQS